MDKLEILLLFLGYQLQLSQMIFIMTLFIDFFIEALTKKPSVKNNIRVFLLLDRILNISRDYVLNQEIY